MPVFQVKRFDVEESEDITGKTVYYVVDSQTAWSSPPLTLEVARESASLLNKGIIVCFPA